MNNDLKRPCSLILICVLSLSAFTATKAASSGWDQLPGIRENIKTPTFPDRDFDITQFGAKADGKTNCSAAIKQAIAQCHAAGGGRVLVSGPGTYYTGPIHFRRRMWFLFLLYTGRLAAAGLAMTTIFTLSPFVAALGHKNSRHREERSDLQLFYFARY